MSDINPYQSPEAETKAVEPLVSEGALTENMLKYLNEASPWLRFLGIIGFVGCGFLAISGFSSLIFMPAVTNLDESMNPFGSLYGDFFRNLGPLMGTYSVFFLGSVVLLFFPSLYIYRFGSKIKTYFQTNSVKELELALKNNKSLWKFTGIATIVSLAIFPAIFIISIIAIVASLAVR